MVFIEMYIDATNGSHHGGAEQRLWFKPNVGFLML